MYCITKIEYLFWTTLIFLLKDFEYKKVFIKDKKVNFLKGINFVFITGFVIESMFIKV